MGKLYTLDKKLLIGSPEIEIGDNKYPIDDRTKTVRKVIKLSKQLSNVKDDETIDQFEVIDRIFELAFGTKAQEVEEVVGDMSFETYQEIIEIIIDAMTGGDPDEFAAKKAKERKEKEVNDIVRKTFPPLVGEAAKRMTEDNNFRNPYESDGDMV